MLEDTTGKMLAKIKNPAFRSYARIYSDIERDFMGTIRSFGLEFASNSKDVTRGQLAKRVDALASQAVNVENDRKSIWINAISPSCLTCRQGVGTETFLTSTQCPRNCYFCFNPNQMQYEYYLSHEHDVCAELRQHVAAGVRYKDLALTGGEPLLHPDLTVSFFELASQLCPGAYTRLYTSGFGLDEELLARLQATGLSEIRFSIKLEESQASIQDTLAKMQLCLGRIPSVMVEMPVMPDQVSQMKELLAQLDSLGIQGINLLELCFPLNNAPEFARRGYRLKSRPYRVLYNYYYAGGVPVDGSEAACIELLEFAVEAGLHMGVHYCSLENKFSGQIYQQNRYSHVAQPWHTMSGRDFFFKSAKVFGADTDMVEVVLRSMGERRMIRDADSDSLEFPVAAIPSLAGILPSVEVAVCLHVAEIREQGEVLRELAIYKTTPTAFDLESDI